jgi:hypothetical protein
MVDRQKMGGMDALPWYLEQLRSAGRKAASEYSMFSRCTFTRRAANSATDVSRDMQLRRNRSTRALWDPNYKDETWINDTVQLIPRLKTWVADHYYADTPYGITEYNWGAENHINGATAQAIFTASLAAKVWTWRTLDNARHQHAHFKAMQMFRNYDWQEERLSAKPACAPQLPTR